MLDSIVSASNCKSLQSANSPQGVGTDGGTMSVNRDEVDRLRKRFMKLDKVSASVILLILLYSQKHQDNSGTIERDEFLSLPQVSSNPLATR